MRPLDHKREEEEGKERYDGATMSPHTILLRLFFLGPGGTLILLLLLLLPCAIDVCYGSRKVVWKNVRALAMKLK